MPIEIKLPKLAENIEGGDVLDVRVSVGDTVAVGQALFEIEAEKTTVEIPSPQAGRIAQLLVKKGDKVKVGQTLCLIDGVGEKQETRSEAPPAPVIPAKAAPIKSAPAQPSAASLPTAKQGSDGHQTSAVITPDQPEKLVPAGPATRRLARELGIDLRQISGTALGGRVTPEDVKSFVRRLASSPATTRGAGPMQAPPLPDFEKWGPVERRPLDSVRRRTAEQMSLAWSQIPHVTQHDQADITDLEAFRKQQERSGPKLTVTAFALRAVASALKQYPQFNSSLDVAGGQLIVKNYCHIGVAVDTERGLLVPVIRDVDRKSVRELGQELTDIADRARQKKIAVEELRGGTFTITNLGGIGGIAFTPIVNYPEVAILGLSRSRMTPVVREGQVVPRLMLPLSLSYDHRVIDGADAARFTRRLAEMFENPLLMLL